MSHKKANVNNQDNRAKLVAERLALQAAVKVQETDDAQKVQDTQTINTTLAQDVDNAVKQTSTTDTLNHKVATFKANDTVRMFCMKCHAPKDVTILEVYTTREGHKRCKGVCPAGHKATRGHLDVSPKDLTTVTEVKV